MPFGNPVLLLLCQLILTSVSKKSSTSVNSPKEPGGLSCTVEHYGGLSCISLVGGLSHPHVQCSMPGVNWGEGGGEKNATGTDQLEKGARYLQGLDG